MFTAVGRIGVNVEAAREAGSEIEKAVEKSLSYCLTAISGSVCCRRELQVLET